MISNNGSIRWAFAAGAASMAALLAGCKSGDSAAAGADLRGEARTGLDDGLVESDAESLLASDGATETSAESIAAQLERDMRALSDLRRERFAAASVDAAPTAPARPRVLFNDPRGDAPAIPATDAGGTTSWDMSHPFALATDGAASESETAPPPTPPATGEAPPEHRLHEAIVSLRRELYQQASYADSPLREYLAMAALTMVDPERALDPEALNDLNPRERELLRTYQSFFTKLGEEVVRSGDEESLARLVEELRQGVMNQGPLTISRAALCISVDGFGRYDVFDKAAFLAGTAQQAVIYTEIEEFTSEKNEKDEWVTDLWQELVIYDAQDDVPVWYQEWQPASDVSSRKRQDFYISHLITLPERLTVGQYVLKVRVKDARTDAIAETGIDFSIVADAKLAATLPQ